MRTSRTRSWGQVQEQDQIQVQIQDQIQDQIRDQIQVQGQVQELDQGQQAGQGMGGTHDTVVDLQQAAERIEQLAWRDIAEHFCLSPGTAASLPIGAQVIDEALVLTSPTIPSLLVNRTIGLGQNTSPSEAQVARIVEVYRVAQVQRYLVHLPSLGPHASEVYTWLQSRGLERYPRSWVKMVRGSERISFDLPSTEIAIAQADRIHQTALADIFRDAFEGPRALGAALASVLGRSNWHMCVALDGKTVLGGGALFVSGEVGYLAYAATSAQARCRGVHAALMYARIQEALERGARWIFTETGEWRADERNHSFKNMLRFGFRMLYDRENWAPVGTRWSET